MAAGGAISSNISFGKITGWHSGMQSRSVDVEIAAAENENQSQQLTDSSFQVHSLFSSYFQ